MSALHKAPSSIPGQGRQELRNRAVTHRREAEKDCGHSGGSLVSVLGPEWPVHTCEGRLASPGPGCYLQTT